MPKVHFFQRWFGGFLRLRLRNDTVWLCCKFHQRAFLPTFANRFCDSPVLIQAEFSAL